VSQVGMLGDTPPARIEKSIIGSRQFEKCLN